MKKIFSIVLFAAVIFLVSADAFGQSGVYSTMGRNPKIGLNQYASGPRKNVKPDYVASSLEKLTTELSLDGFQQAVVKNELEKAKNSEENIMTEDGPSESKEEKIAILRQKLDDEITKILTPEQQEKFTKLKDRIKKKK